MKRVPFSFSLVLAFVAAILLVAGCNILNKSTPGSYLFLVARTAPSTRVLVGDSSHIGGVACNIRILPVASFDTSQQRLTVLNRPVFPTDNLSSVFIKYIGGDWLMMCPSESLTPLYHGYESAGSSGLLSIDSGGVATIGIDTALFRLGPHQEYSFSTHADTLRGRYTIFPDTTTYPFILLVSRVWTVHNYGYWPADQLGFGD